MAIMKAVIYNKYGPPEVLQIKDVEKPTPHDNEVLIKNYATTAHVGDTRMREFRVPRKYWLPMRLFLGITKPKRPTLGMEVAGVIESVGKRVTDFKPGDEVMALTGFTFGGYAEYSRVNAIGGDENKGMVVHKPKNLNFEEAACVPTGALTALVHLQKINIKKDDSILIYGASGSVGTYAVQLAKYYGAIVTGVCSTANLDLVRSLGADQVIDYTGEDFAKNGETYDIIFDAVFKLPRSKAKKLLKEDGIYDSSHAKVRKLTHADLISIKDLVEKNTIKPVIDRTYSLEDIVKAHRYVDKGHKKGHVPITITNRNKEKETVKKT